PARSRPPGPAGKTRTGDDEPLRPVTAPAPRPVTRPASRPVATPGPEAGDQADLQADSTRSPERARQRPPPPPRRAPPGPRPPGHRTDLPGLAAGGGHADAHEQPRPRGGRTSGPAHRLRWLGPRRPQLGRVRRHR